jgi:hypothetical protein
LKSPDAPAYWTICVRVKFSTSTCSRDAPTESDAQSIFGLPAIA